MYLILEKKNIINIMKICVACKGESFEIDKITEEAIINKKSVGWKVKRGEYTVAPNDMVPFLIGIRKKLPKNWDTIAEIDLGDKYSNRWIYYWAANKASSYKIKNAPDAYGVHYTNSGITKTGVKGEVIFKLECPQPYQVKNITYYPHIHFMISDKKNEHWELKVRTISIICKIDKKKVENAFKNKSYLIIDALPKEYYEKQHIPNSVNLFYKDALQMSNIQIDKFIRSNLTRLNNDIQELVKNKKLALKDIPIIVYCYNKKCDAGKTLARRLLEAKYHKILDYDEGIQGYFNSKNI